MTNPTTEEMAREVYEAITGKCWHEIIGDRNEHLKVCSCGDVTNKLAHFHNPPLSTSIDAWHEHIFPVMSDEQKKSYDYYLRFGFYGYKWELTAMHHLTAAYNMIKGGK